MNKLLLAIPHSSTELADLEVKNPLIEEIKEEALIHADLYIDELFDSYDLDEETVFKVIFDKSRYSVDVERFWDNNKEICYLKGQGKFYTKLNSGKTYRSEKDINDEYKNAYWKYHKVLKDCIEKEGCNFLVDCHSFNDDKKEYADICLGWNEDKTKPSQKLINKICELLKQFNVSVSFNYPYSGSMTVETDKQYKSLMIEINKNLYLLDNKTKCADFYKIKNLVTSILRVIQRNEEEKS